MPKHLPASFGSVLILQAKAGHISSGLTEINGGSKIKRIFHVYTDEKNLNIIKPK